MPDPVAPPAPAPAAPAPAAPASTTPPSAPPAAAPPAAPAPAAAAPPAQPPSAIDGRPPAAPTPAPGTTPPAEPPKPVEYKLELPQGSLLGPKAVEDTIAFAKANNLSNDAAKAILERDSKAAAAQRDLIVQHQDAQSVRWYGELEKDPVFGGENLPKYGALIKRGLEQDDPAGELRKGIKEMRMENNPALFKFLARVYGRSAEPGLVTGGRPGGTETKADKSAAAIIYPNQATQS